MILLAICGGARAGTDGAACFLLSCGDQMKDGSVEKVCPCGSGKKFKHCHGLKRSMPTVENTAAIVFNPDEKRIAVVTKDILVNQISRDGPIIAKSFDRLTKNDIRAMSAVVADAMGLMFRHMPVDTEDYKPTCARLLSSILTTFMASIEVARHGYRRPYGAMVRNIVEGIATILHISIEPAALKDFHAGNLQSTKSITVAKKVLPEFGRVYGTLSQYFPFRRPCYCERMR